MFVKYPAKSTQLLMYCKWLTERNPHHILLEDRTVMSAMKEMQRNEQIEQQKIGWMVSANNVLLIPY